MLVTIDVTQQCIDDGVARDCQHCPIARAIMARLADGFFVDVVSCGVWIYRTGSRRSVFNVLIPANAKAFIDDFDDGRPVFPFSFDLDIPTEYLRRAA